MFDGPGLHIYVAAEIGIEYVAIWCPATVKIRYYPEDRQSMVPAEINQTLDIRNRHGLRLCNDDIAGYRLVLGQDKNLL